MKFLRFTALLLSVLLATLLLVAATALVYPNMIRKPLHNLVAAQTGLQLRIAELNTATDPLRLELRNLDLKNAKGEPLLNTEHARLELLGWPSLDAPFFTLQLTAPTVFVTRDAGGNSNWPEVAAAEEEPGKDQGFVLPGDFNFYLIAIRDAALIIAQPQWERRIKLPEIQVERNNPGVANLLVKPLVGDDRLTLRGKARLREDQGLALDLELRNDAFTTDLTTIITGQVISGQLRAALKDSALFSRLSGQPVPALPSLTLDTAFKLDSSLTLSGLTASLGEQTLRGDIRYAFADQHLTAQLRGEQWQLDDILQGLQQGENEPAGEAAPSQNSNTETPIDWAPLQGMQAEIGLELAALQAQGWQVKDLALKATLTPGEQAPVISLDTRSGVIAPPDQSLDVSALQLNATLTPLDTQTTGQDASIKGRLTLNKTIEATLDGTVNLNALARQSLQLTVNAPNSQALWNLANLPYREAGALALNTAIESDNTNLEVGSTLKLGEQALNATLNYAFADNSTHPTAQLNITGSGIDTRFTQAESPAQETPEKTTPPAEHLFAREPFALDQFREIDANLAVDIQKLTTPYNSIDELLLNAQLRDGVLSSRASRISLSGGALELDFDGDFSKPEVVAGTTVKMHGTDVGAMGLEQAAGISGGSGNVFIELSGRGDSPHALAASLKGRIDIKLREATMRNNKLNLVGSDLFSELVSKLNPFAKSDPVTELECVSVHFDAEQGVLSSDKELHVETSKMRIIGDGDVNLDKESLSLHFTPIARKGIGVNLGNLARLVKVSGDLRSPGLSMDAGGVLSSALSTGAALSTGGVSLIAQNLVERAMNAGSACDPNKKIELALPEEPAAQEEEAPVPANGSP